MIEARPKIGAPLAGITAIALEHAVAAPLASCRLADAGARVIKVERPGGDFARAYDEAANGQSSYFVWLNRNKESVCLDLSQPEDAAELASLFKEADVFIQNLKPGALEKFGFGIADLRRDHPRLITCSITGYGPDGPLSDRKAYDLLVQAESGLCSITGTPEAESRVGVSIVDLATGLTAYHSILEAIIERSVTGVSQHIELSMFDVMAEWMTVPLMNFEAGTPPGRPGLRHPSIAPYGVYSCSDGSKILLSIQSEVEWKALVSKVLRRPDLLSAPELTSNVERVRNRALTDQLVQEAIGQMSATQAATALQAANIAFGSLNTLADLSQHPHLRRVQIETEHGTVSYPAPPAVFSFGQRDMRPVPAKPTRSR